MADKNYIGQATLKQVEYNGGSFEVMKVGICLEDIGLDLTGMKIPASVMSHKNGNHYFDFEITEKRQADEWGKTHSVYFTDRPDPAGAGNAPRASAPAPVAQSSAPRANASQSAPQPPTDYPEEEINPEDIPF